MSDHTIPEREWHQVAPVIPRPDPLSARPEPSGGVEKERAMFDERDYIEMRITSVDEKGVMRIEALAKELAVAMRANAIAIDKAEAAVNERLKGMNEFRETLTEQAATFARVTAVDSLEAQVIAKLDAFREQLRGEIHGLRDTCDARFEAMAAAGLARADAQRMARDAEMKAVWKFIYGLATAIAVIETILRLTPPG